MSDDIAITNEDVHTVMDSHPVIALTLKCAALIRMLKERDAQIAELELSKNADDTT